MNNFLVIFTFYFIDEHVISKVEKNPPSNKQRIRNEYLLLLLSKLGKNSILLNKLLINFISFSVIIFSFEKK